MDCRKLSLVRMLVLLLISAANIAYPLQSNNSNVPPSVILISIDTLRADRVGIYGYGHTPTPHIDSIADHGTVFTQVDSQIPLTLPSHTSLFTSTYPFANRVEENAQFVPSNLVTLASLLKTNGYQTGAFIGSALLSHRYGLDKGFDTYDDPFERSGDQNLGPYSARVRRDGALVTRSALRWLEARTGQPVFAFVHLFDIHTPYSVRQFSGVRLIPNPAGYDAEIEYVDQVLGHFKDALIRSGWWQQSLVILLSDHGESLGEHGEVSHGYFVYESTLHVPLIVHWPANDSNHPRRVSKPVGLVDVAPSILGYLHIAAPPSFVGTDIFDTRSNIERQVYSESAYAHDAFHWAMLRRVRMGSMEYIEAPIAELYDLRSDPAERNNIIKSRAAEARSFKQDLQTLLSRYANPHSRAVSDMSPETVERLRSLGYLAGGGSLLDVRSGPDPKERLSEYQTYEKALAALYSDKTPVAVAYFQQLLAKDPANTLARYYLGETYLKLSRSQDALREWQIAANRDRTYEPALAALGDVYLVQRLPAKARDAFEQALILSPSDYETQLHLAIAEEELGLVQDAKRHMEAACKLAYQDLRECENEFSRLRRKFQYP